MLTRKRARFLVTLAKRSEPKLTFHYLKLHVRGDPIRAMLSHAGVTYTDHHISFREWPELKSTMPGGQLPCLEFEDGKKMGESVAITRYLGRRYGYYPTDPMKAFECDMLLDMYADVIGKVYKPHFEREETKREAMMPGIVAAITKFLTNAKAYFSITSERLTIADFWIGSLYTNYLANPNIKFGKKEFAQLLVDFPTFEGYGKRYSAAVKKHLDSRVNYPI